MNIKLLALAGVVALAGCGAPSGSVVINEKTVSNISLTDLAASMSSISASEGVNAIKSYCGVGAKINLASVKQRLTAAGYQELGTARGKSITVLAKPEKAPVMTIGKRGDITVCAVFMDPKEAKREKIEPLLRSRLDNTAFGLPASMLGAEKASKGDFVWVSGKNENHLYITITTDENRALAYATR